MNINDIVLPIKTCKRLKETGYEFPNSVFVWLMYIGAKYNVIIRKDVPDLLHYHYYVSTLTLHEVYCWFLELSRKPEFRGDTPSIQFIYGDTEKNDRVIFSASDSYIGRSTELNPLLAADRYINNLLDKGILNHG